MLSRVVVLGSGSSGNATLLQAEGFGLLIDCGFGHLELSSRLQVAGASWNDVNAVVLTHTHTDHWNRYAFEHFRRRKIPLYLHPEHHATFASLKQFEPLKKADLLCDYAAERPFALGPYCVQALPIPHDADPTHALRFSWDNGQRAFGLATDLGRVDSELIDFLRGVDVLALEFNHDVPMQKSSPRPYHLIQRILGDSGHLSNEQAAEAAKEWVASDTAKLRALIQIHLSRECNTPELARSSIEAWLMDASPETRLITSLQTGPTPCVEV
jgi:phosphoribosyl 1,2-cyclic phosphodiesterase